MFSLGLGSDSLIIAAGRRRSDTTQTPWETAFSRTPDKGTISIRSWLSKRPWQIVLRQNCSFCVCLNKVGLWKILINPRACPCQTCLKRWFLQGRFSVMQNATNLERVIFSKDVQPINATRRTTVSMKAPRNFQKPAQWCQPCPNKTRRLNAVNPDVWRFTKIVFFNTAMHSF